MLYLIIAAFAARGKTTINTKEYNMLTIFQRVAKFNQDSGTELNRTQLPDDEFNNEYNMLEEELTEFYQARGNRTEMADALGDVAYVLMGTMAKLGMNFEKIMTEICNSNDTKYQNGALVKNEAGKIQKGPDFKAPDLSFTEQVENISVTDSKPPVSISGLTLGEQPTATTTFKLGNF